MRVSPWYIVARPNSLQTTYWLRAGLVFGTFTRSVTSVRSLWSYAQYHQSRRIGIVRCKLMGPFNCTLIVSFCFFKENTFQISAWSLKYVPAMVGHGRPQAIASHGRPWLERIWNVIWNVFGTDLERIWNVFRVSGTYLERILVLGMDLERIWNVFRPNLYNRKVPLLYFQRYWTMSRMALIPGSADLHPDHKHIALDGRLRSTPGDEAKPFTMFQ